MTASPPACAPARAGDPEVLDPRRAPGAAVTDAVTDLSRSHGTWLRFDPAEREMVIWSGRCGARANR